MRRRLVATIAALAVIGLGAGAVPAFTAESGTLNVSITAASPAPPCLVVSPGTLDLGTLPFSRPTADSVAKKTLSLASCATGTTKQNVAVAGTDAVGASGARWTLPADGFQTGCVVDVYTMLLLNDVSSPDRVIDAIGTSPKTIFNRTTTRFLEWSAGQSRDFDLRLTMPCEGSNGAGETKTLSVTFTAVVV